MRARGSLFSKFMTRVGVYCLAQVAMILLHNSIKEIQTSAEGLHPALDYRSQGYAIEDLTYVLHTYGPEGRQRYAVFLITDLCLYMWSYATVLSMMLKAGSSVAKTALLKRVYVLPYIAAVADAAENVLMLTILARYPGLTEPLGEYVMAASRLKWQLLYYTASAVAGVGCYCLFVAARQALQEQQEQQQSQGTRQQQSQTKQHKQQKQHGKRPR